MDTMCPYPTLHGHHVSNIYFVLRILPTYWHQLATYRKLVKPGLADFHEDHRVMWRLGRFAGTPCVLL